MTTRVLAGVGVLLFGASVLAQAPKPSWLDSPLSNWNTPGRVVPRPTIRGETIPEITKRCAFLPMVRNTPGERMVGDAGWLAFHLFDRAIIQRDVEIVGGLAGADGMCRPGVYNVFVFVGGQLAGTLSPAEMTSRIDGSIGAIRLSDTDIIAAEFVRYTESDALCCPSGRMTVRYQIDRKQTRPVIVPVGVQPTRR